MISNFCPDIAFFTFAMYLPPQLILLRLISRFGMRHANAAGLGDDHELSQEMSVCRFDLQNDRRGFQILQLDKADPVY
jgi:hypothetical protein